MKKLPNRYLFGLKIILIVGSALCAVWLFFKNLYFSATLLFIIMCAIAVSLYFDRKKLITRMERMIAGIRHADFTTHFAETDRKDELQRLSHEMNEALEAFRNRTHDSMMDEAETQAWQKLISVLTHEIMNSIAPIISLSETMSERPVSETVNIEEYKIMQQAMHTIHRRGKGLLTFVENYRKLMRIPQPMIQPIRVQRLLESLHQLFASDNIQFNYSVYPEELILNADRNMVEQIVINLIKNAHEACVNRTNPQIKAKAEKIGKHIQISVSDNGTGIMPEAIDKIFIPFYTTKPNGSGIGLSLCRQFMLRHKGKISVISDKTGSKFVLQFPA